MAANSDGAFSKLLRLSSVQPDKQTEISSIMILKRLTSMLSGTWSTVERQTQQVQPLGLSQFLILKHIDQKRYRQRHKRLPKHFVSILVPSKLIIGIRNSRTKEARPQRQSVKE
jgi:hypothetical protein